MSSTQKVVKSAASKPVKKTPSSSSNIQKLIRATERLGINASIVISVKVHAYMNHDTAFCFWDPITIDVKLGSSIEDVFKKYKRALPEYDGHPSIVGFSCTGARLTSGSQKVVTNHSSYVIIDSVDEIRLLVGCK